MRILAIETSGQSFSLALAEDGRLVAESFWHAGLKHSERLVPAVARILSEAGWETKSLARIAVSTGPGSFTGIRVGLTCARTMAQGLKIPLVGVDTLELLAAALPAGEQDVHAAIDALRGEVYTRADDEVVIRPAAEFAREIARDGKPSIIVGNAVITYREVFEGILGKQWVPAPLYLQYPRAGVLALMAGQRKTANYRSVKPLYIRRSWAEEKHQPKAAAPRVS